MTLRFIFILAMIILPLSVSGQQPDNGEGNDTEPVKYTSLSLIERQDAFLPLGRSLETYRLNYILPLGYAYQTYPDELLDTKRDHLEIVFQLSTKVRFYNSDTFKGYFGYTQRSFWQAYDDKNSRPFRESNYNPSLFLRTNRPLQLFSTEKLYFDFIFEHESNGQKDVYTRSWNRVSIAIFNNDGRIKWELKSWFRIPELLHDENPEIIDYMGSNELRVSYIQNYNISHLKLRLNPFTGFGAIEADTGYLIPDSEALALVHIFYGYGESLADYKNLITRLGIGILFAY